MLRITLGVLGGLAFLVVLGVLKKPEEPLAHGPTTPPAHGNSLMVPAASALQLLSSKGEVDEYSTTIKGKIRNNSTKQYSYAQVTFKLYNGTGEQVGTALANINNLGPGVTWSFTAHGFTPAERFSLGEITGW